MEWIVHSSKNQPKHPQNRYIIVVLFENYHKINKESFVFIIKGAVKGFTIYQQAPKIASILLS